MPPQRSLAAESTPNGPQVNNQTPNGHLLHIYMLGIHWKDHTDHETATGRSLEVCGCPIDINSPLNHHQMDPK